MGGISANKPILHLVTGPMMPGKHKGVRIGACTDCRNNWARFRARHIDLEDISAVNEELAPTVSTRPFVFHQSWYSGHRLKMTREEPAVLWALPVQWLVFWLALA